MLDNIDTRYLKDPSPQDLRAEQIKNTKEKIIFDSLPYEIEQTKKYFFVNETDENKYFIAQDEQGNNNFFCVNKQTEPAPRQSRADILPDETQKKINEIIYNISCLINKRSKTKDRAKKREYTNDIKELQAQARA